MKRLLLTTLLLALPALSLSTASADPCARCRVVVIASTLPAAAPVAALTAED